MQSRQRANLTRILQVCLVTWLVVLHGGLLVWVAPVQLTWSLSIGLLCVTLLLAFIGTRYAHRLAEVYIAGSGFAVEVRSGWLSEIIDAQARRAGLAFSPACVVFEDETINAFVAGGSASRARLFLSSGCLRKLSRRRLAVIVAHEMSHIRNGDMLALFFMQGLFAVLAAPLWVVWLSVRLVRPHHSVRALRWALRGTYWCSLLLAPLASFAMAVFLRRWEYQADRQASLVMGKQGFLETMRCVYHVQRVPAESPVRVAGLREWSRKILRSHPPLEQRIKAIQSS